MSKLEAVKRRTGTQAVRSEREISRGSRNRERLIEAAIEVLLDEGMAQFTSARIAAAAGLHKPAFYAQFKNVQDCLKNVAMHIATARAREMLVLQSAAVDGNWLGDSAFEHSRQFIERLLVSVGEKPALYRVLARFHVEAGPLGDAVREINAYVRERWTEHFWRIAVQVGIDPKHFKEVAEMADHVIGITHIAVVRVLDGRITDIPAEAERVARYDFAIMGAEFQRMLRDRPNLPQSPKSE